MLQSPFSLQPRRLSSAAPLRSLPSPVVYRPAPEESAALSSGERPRLLLVESDPALGEMLTEVLAAHYRVEAVGDTTAAWTDAQHVPPDLVLLGLYIHGKDNLALIRSIRADPRMVLLPILVLTSSADRALMSECLAAGASNFLLKPFTMPELLACVRFELELHHPLMPSRA